jgi:hypothetical protein
VVGTEVLRDVQLFRFESFEPFREAIAGAIEEMPGLLMQRLKKGGDWVLAMGSFRQK